MNHSPRTRWAVATAIVVIVRVLGCGSWPRRWIFGFFEAASMCGTAVTGTWIGCFISRSASGVGVCIASVCTAIEQCANISFQSRFLGCCAALFVVDFFFFFLLFGFFFRCCLFFAATSAFVLLIGTRASRCLMVGQEATLERLLLGHSFSCTAWAYCGCRNFWFCRLLRGSRGCRRWRTNSSIRGCRTVCRCRGFCTRRPCCRWFFRCWCLDGWCPAARSYWLLMNWSIRIIAVSLTKMMYAWCVVCFFFFLFITCQF